MRVIAIDPGYERLGLAILEKKNGEKERLVYSECFHTSKKLEFAERLYQTGQQICKIIKEFGPEALAVESLFFTNNQKTALHVAEIRGVIMYEALDHKLKYVEYTPIQIKVAVTGDGRADKKQIFAMVQKLIKITKKIELDDEYDAIATGLTFLASNGYPQKK